MVAGVAVTAARQAGGAEAVAAYPPPGQPAPGSHAVDADTLEALDSQAVRDIRAVNGVSDR